MSIEPPAVEPESVPPAEPVAAPPPSRPQVSGVFGVLIIAQLLILASGCVVGLFYVAGSPEPGVTREVLTARMMADPQFLIMALLGTQVAMALALWKGPRAFETIPPGGLAPRLGWSDEPIRWLEVLVVLAGTWACGALVIVPLRFLRGPSTGALATFAKTSAETSPLQFAMLVLVGAVCAGLLEELLFRGFTQRRLIERWGVGVGVGVTSFIFALWHFDVEQSLYAFVVGVWLGLAAVRTGTTVTGAFAHILNNAWSFVAHRFLSTQPDEVEPLFVGVGAVVLATSAWTLWRLTAARYTRMPSA
ncbi:MAG: CPBP family intramembrane metalloprotease [Archangiaceae bacterium]|nr:CPBP family intramembrane metalloprotease [Archangiaceae bacterium]